MKCERALIMCTVWKRHALVSPCAESDWYSTRCIDGDIEMDLRDCCIKAAIPAVLGKVMLLMCSREGQVKD